MEYKRVLSNENTMSMEAKDIKGMVDMQRYVEGCLNDLAEGISTVDETMGYMKAYTLRVMELARQENQTTN